MFMNPELHPYFVMLRKLIETENGTLEIADMRKLIEAYRTSAEHRLNGINEICRPLIDYAIASNQTSAEEESKLSVWKQPRFVVSVEWE